jgi:hypothetical protein
MFIQKFTVVSKLYETESLTNVRIEDAYECYPLPHSTVAKRQCFSAIPRRNRFRYLQ